MKLKSTTHLRRQQASAQARQEEVSIVAVARLAVGKGRRACRLNSCCCGSTTGCMAWSSQMHNIPSTAQSALCLTQSPAKPILIICPRSSCTANVLCLPASLRNEVETGGSRQISLPAASIYGILRHNGLRGLPSLPCLCLSWPDLNDRRCTVITISNPLAKLPRPVGV